MHTRVKIVNRIEVLAVWVLVLWRFWFFMVWKTTNLCQSVTTWGYWGKPILSCLQICLPYMYI